MPTGQGARHGDKKRGDCGEKKISNHTIIFSHTRYKGMNTKKPFLIAGPCSVESREQLHTVVEALSEIPQVAMIRCGVWKPRTRPGGFEGLGETALQWMSEIKGCRFCCETIMPEHAELALRYGVDALWIGARTTANPFMVQELTEVLRGTGVTVMVKNAPSPDVKLWMGAIERCHKVGLTDVMAVHRGFDVFKNNGYRNNPLWEMAIDLRHAMPEVPILCDPSHIAGRREPLLSLSQTAMDLGLDGLMVEVHPSPETALTDSNQQITPSELKELLGHLVLRETDSHIADEELRLLREQIDHLDKQILQLVAARTDVSLQIAHVKARENLAVFQPRRWDELLNHRTSIAAQLGLDTEFVKELFEKIHAESVRVQEREMGVKEHK